MPYIPSNRRREINNELTTIGDQFLPQNAGDLNYIVSTFIDNFLVIFIFSVEIRFWRF